MLTGVRNGKPDRRCKAFDGALPISEDIDDLEPPTVRQRLGETGELIENRDLGLSAILFARCLAWLTHARPFFMIN